MFLTAVKDGLFLLHCKLHRCNGFFNIKKGLSNDLKANGSQFHFDYQNGQWGFNTDPARGADTFVPFSSMSSLKMIFETGYQMTISGAPNVLKFEAPKTGEFLMLVHVSGRTHDGRHDHFFGSMDVSGCNATQIFHTFENMHFVGAQSIAGCTVIRGYAVTLTEGSNITVTTALSTPVNYGNTMILGT